MTKLKSLSNAVSHELTASLHQPRSLSHNAMHSIPDEPEDETTLRLGDRAL